MLDTERIDALERDLADLKTKFTKLSLDFRELSGCSDRRRDSIQSAIDDLQQSINLIFTNIKVPNVIFDPSVRHTIT